MKKITIIGAGIGGLTTAIALQKKGFDVEIFENTPTFKNAGSGINLAINAMQVFKRLGVYDDIMKHANYTNSMNALSKKMDVITCANFEKFKKKFGVKTVAIHRAALHEILVSHIGSAKIHLNKKLEYLEEREGGITLTFADGTTHNAEMVIGADGIHSNVRKSIFNNTELRDANQVCWRGISNAKMHEKYEVELNEIWGKGNRFGFVHLSSEKTYWFALINKDKFKTKDADLLEMFSDYPDLVKDIISCTEKSEILCNEIWDLKPLDKWFKGNVCLVGDACHATTPNMGQGAVQAIESALALSICLKEEHSIENAFKRYENLRKGKANRITKTSWWMVKLAQSDNAAICFFRNLIAKLTPKLAEKQSEKIFTLNY